MMDFPLLTLQPSQLKLRQPEFSSLKLAYPWGLSFWAGWGRMNESLLQSALWCESAGIPAE